MVIPERAGAGASRSRPGLCAVEMWVLIILMDTIACSSRLEVQAGELAKESAQRETGSLGAGSDCASTRGMAGSIISSYTLPDR